MFVKVLQRDKLNGRTDTPWRAHLGLSDGVGSEWRALYKPPLIKRAADLQRRVLHGIIAVNAFVSVINSDVGHVCEFCPHREIVFHCFMECFRLLPLFVMLEQIFGLFGEFFSQHMFILGYRYSQKKKGKCQLLNFIVGRAKMAVYLSRRNKIETAVDDDAVFVFVKILKARLKIDFKYYRMMKDLEKFSSVWCYKHVLCSCVDEELFFGHVLR